MNSHRSTPVICVDLAKESKVLEAKRRRKVSSISTRRIEERAREESS